MSYKNKKKITKHSSKILEDNSHLYCFFENKRTKGHPSINLGVHNGIWETIEITHKPAGYEFFDKNPYSKDDSKRPSFYRRHISQNNVGCRGEMLRDYSLSKTDKEKIIKMVSELKDNKVLITFNKTIKKDEESRHFTF